MQEEPIEERAWSELTLVVSWQAMEATSVSACGSVRIER
jgi:hypothetical protein